ncbi:hypothetical protein DDB_G0290239 [Dictyostelium discoideum AX4]|uniref:Transmembrane protein n=1 Tax=Dictyostelium discoideum TaxID=44689 RepID=Q54GF0_DICDI|nr:hypothetical protein DDB_G0290239 [Dictyostelium discoideum AX4]EAL62341.1 hypothetical protein DDB_G0290239 [Dictyostelium discoideum AX4]|eukprot:XP_635828.1 hypothetical protein DDB_G0290239 [Dictyostelium discoideum AX4]
MFLNKKKYKIINIPISLLIVFLILISFFCPWEIIKNKNNSGDMITFNIRYLFSFFGSNNITYSPGLSSSTVCLFGILTIILQFINFWVDFKINACLPPAFNNCRSVFIYDEFSNPNFLSFLFYNSITTSPSVGFKLTVFSNIISILLFLFTLFFNNNQEKNNNRDKNNNFKKFSRKRSRILKRKKKNNGMDQITRKSKSKIKIKTTTISLPKNENINENQTIININKNEDNKGDKDKNKNFEDFAGDEYISEETLLIKNKNNERENEGCGENEASCESGESYTFDSNEIWENESSGDNDSNFEIQINTI